MNQVLSIFFYVKCISFSNFFAYRFLLMMRVNFQGQIFSKKNLLFSIIIFARDNTWPAKTSFVTSRLEGSRIPGYTPYYWLLLTMTMIFPFFFFKINVLTYRTDVSFRLKSCHDNEVHFCVLTDFFLFQDDFTAKLGWRSVMVVCRELDPLCS